MTERFTEYNVFNNPERTRDIQYESDTTERYFGNWDELELEGNPRLKERLRENILYAEKYNEEMYKFIAEKLGLTIEEFKAKLQERVNELVARSEFFVVTPVDIFNRILNTDGRWRSFFETRKTGSPFKPQDERKEPENRMFGFDENTEDSQRPIYGYFSDGEHGAINEQGEIPPPSNVSHFGAITFKVKKDVAVKKATITFGDSLRGACYLWPEYTSDTGWCPSPAAKPHFTSLPMIEVGAPERILELTHNTRIPNWGARYTEAQYHDQLTLDDIESIHISTHNGLSPEDIAEIRRIFNIYKKQHPESTIQLIKF